MTDFRSNPRHTNDSKIAAARLTAGITQAQLAERIGVGEATLRRWETGETFPTAVKLKAIASALAVSIDQLI